MSDALLDASDKDLELLSPPNVTLDNILAQRDDPKGGLQASLDARLAYEKEKKEKSVAEAQEEYRKRQERHREDQFQAFRQAYLRSGGEDTDSVVRAAYQRYVEKRAAEDLAARQPAEQRRRPLTLS